MKLPKKIIEEVDARTVEVHCKVCDSGHYALKNHCSETLATRDDYVPSFFPGEHYGDYLILDIDLETGRIVNWKRPEPVEVSRAFGIISEDEES
jgi:hypothetical protein